MGEGLCIPDHRWKRQAGFSYETRSPHSRSCKASPLQGPLLLPSAPHRLALKRKRAEKNRQAAAEYAKILAQRQKEAKEAKELRRKRSASLRESRNSAKSS